MLTEKAKGLFLVVMALRQRGEECFGICGDHETVLVDRERKLVRPLSLLASDGRVLGPDDVALVNR